MEGSNAARAAAPPGPAPGFPPEGIMTMSSSGVVRAERPGPAIQNRPTNCGAGLLRPALELPLSPLGSLLRLAPMIKLDEPFVRAVQIIPVRDFDVGFSGRHSFIAFDEQRLGFQIFFLARQNCTQQALCPKSPPVFGLVFAIKGHNLSRERLGFDELPF